MLPAAIYQLTAPGYKVTVDGGSPSKAFVACLVSVSITLNDGKQSDQLTLTFSESAKFPFGNLKIPKSGAEIKVWIGYEVYKILMGVFHVDQVSLSGSASGPSVSISAVPKLLLDEQSRTWAEKTKLEKVIQDIAKENKLTPKVSKKFKPVMLPNNENQSRESDMSFLTRLGEKYGAMVKPAGDCLLFLEKGEATTASGVPLSTPNLGPTDIVQWSTQLSDREAYEGVVSVWQDRDKAQQIQVVAGKKTGKKTFYLKHLYSNEKEAKTAAESKLKELKRGTTKLSLTVAGRPDIIANGKVKLKKLHKEIDGEWLVESATHKLDSSGYQCTAQCYQEKK